MPSVADDALVAARERMVATQIAARGVADERVLAAMRAVPREAFVSPGSEHQAHDDRALPIEAGQTISQPYIVARMLQLAALAPADRVLDVGTGSGYAAAVMCFIAARVYTIEWHAELARAAARRFDALGLRNIEARVGDGRAGWPEAAPFDAILVAAGAAQVPAALKAQLSEGGRLVMPVGPPHGQQLVCVRRQGGRFEERRGEGVRFVPLLGAGA